MSRQPRTLTDLWNGDPTSDRITTARRLVALLNMRVVEEDREHPAPEDEASYRLRAGWIAWVALVEQTAAKLSPAIDRSWLVRFLAHPRAVRLLVDLVALGDASPEAGLERRTVTNLIGERLVKDAVERGLLDATGDRIRLSSRAHSAPLSGMLRVPPCVAPPGGATPPSPDAAATLVFAFLESEPELAAIVAALHENRLSLSELKRTPGVGHATSFSRAIRLLHDLGATREMASPQSPSLEVGAATPSHFLPETTYELSREWKAYAGAFEDVVARLPLTEDRLRALTWLQQLFEPFDTDYDELRLEFPWMPEAFAAARRVREDAVETALRQLDLFGVVRRDSDGGVLGFSVRKATLRIVSSPPVFLHLTGMRTGAGDPPGTGADEGVLQSRTVDRHLQRIGWVTEDGTHLTPRARRVLDGVDTCLRVRSQLRRLLSNATAVSMLSFLISLPSSRATVGIRAVEIERSLGRTLEPGLIQACADVGLLEGHFGRLRLPRVSSPNGEPLPGVDKLLDAALGIAPAIQRYLLFTRTHVTLPRPPLPRGDLSLKAVDTLDPELVAWLAMVGRHPAAPAVDGAALLSSSGVETARSPTPVYRMSPEELAIHAEEKSQLLGLVVLPVAVAILSRLSAPQFAGAAIEGLTIDAKVDIAALIAAGFLSVHLDQDGETIMAPGERSSRWWDLRHLADGGPSGVSAVRDGGIETLSSRRAWVDPDGVKVPGAHLRVALASWDVLPVTIASLVTRTGLTKRQVMPIVEELVTTGVLSADGDGHVVGAGVAAILHALEEVEPASPEHEIPWLLEDPLTVLADPTCYWIATVLQQPHTVPGSIPPPLGRSWMSSARLEDFADLQRDVVRWKAVRLQSEPMLKEVRPPNAGDRIDEGLERLEAARLVTRRASGPVVEYALGHDARLLLEQRQRIIEAIPTVTANPRRGMVRVFADLRSNVAAGRARRAHVLAAHLREPEPQTEDLRDVDRMWGTPPGTARAALVSALEAGLLLRVSGRLTPGPEVGELVVNADLLRARAAQSRFPTHRRPSRPEANGPLAAGPGTTPSL